MKSLPNAETQWRLAFDTVVQAGRPATSSELLGIIRQTVPNYRMSQLSPNLCTLSVNDYNRGHYQPHAAPRRSDGGHRYDLLFKTTASGLVRYEPYRSVVHGVFELFEDPSLTTNSKMRARPLTTGQLEDAILEAQADADRGARFDATDQIDARTRVSLSIVIRRGQPAFRAALLNAYGGACAITGTQDADVLEAAHIMPYMGDHTNHVTNGLLLRADVHTLFDLGKIWIEGHMVCVAPQISAPEYRNLHGRPLRLPHDAKLHPSLKALTHHAVLARGT
ncbi:HNH endonuclease [Pseudoduganella aquatica]|uniref:HNH endonuclease n=1 Tax=Pseudoduganella aquatica TaxID=2660641 RepID=UPI001E35993E|nr:HNH endonuclease [Pseudoduganella aquatica]